MEIQRKDLFCQKAYIDGEWVSSAKTFQVLNPYDQSVLAEVPDMEVKETRDAIDAADRAFVSWKNTTARERAGILRSYFQLLTAHSEDLSRILSTEQGKPLFESRGEVTYGASFMEWYAEEAPRTYGEVIPSRNPDKRIVTLKQPIGVVAAITPWNFPIAMITRKIAPALAAGCTVVIKPAEDTPLSALALAVLAEEAGFPPGVFNVVTTNNPETVGKELTTNPKVKKVSFTGSTEIGKLLMEQCASSVKKVSLELGGNAPFIVFEDADLEVAVDDAIICKYRNAGQTCVCANRLYVHESIYNEFVDRLTPKVAGLQLGSGLEEKTNVGPMINQQAMDKVEDLVADALGKGAELLVGGRAASGRSQFFEPTVMTNISPDMRISHTEIFGPVMPVIKFRTEGEVIEMANQTPYGLAAYFYGTDYARIWRVAEALEFGVIGINTGITTAAEAPFGGIKESGFGKEGSKYGMDDYLYVKYLCIGGMR